MPHEHTACTTLLPQHGMHNTPATTPPRHQRLRHHGQPHHGQPQHGLRISARDITAYDTSAARPHSVTTRASISVGAQEPGTAVGHECFAPGRKAWLPSVQRSSPPGCICTRAPLLRARIRDLGQHQTLCGRQVEPRLTFWPHSCIKHRLRPRYGSGTFTNGQHCTHEESHH